jgi:hypothetical protein
MSLTILLPPEKSRLRALLDHFFMTAGCFRHDCRLRRMGQSASGVPALLAALSSRRSGRPVADRPDESHRSSAVLRRLHGLGAGDMARSPGPISTTIRDAQADYLLAREGQPADLALRDRKLLHRRASCQSREDHGRGQGSWPHRATNRHCPREVERLDGDRRFPGELRLPHVATIVRVASRAELKDRSRFETRYYVSSAALSAPRAAEAVRAATGPSRTACIGCSISRSVTTNHT